MITYQWQQTDDKSVLAVSSSALQARSLVLSAYTLPPYHQYTVSVQVLVTTSTYTLPATATCFFNTTSRPLVPVTVANSIQRPVNQPVTLDASLSYEPNVSPDSRSLNALSFTWQCWLDHTPVGFNSSAAAPTDPNQLCTWCNHLPLERSRSAFGVAAGQHAEPQRQLGVRRVPAARCWCAAYTHLAAPAY